MRSCYSCNRGGETTVSKFTALTFVRDSPLFLSSKETIMEMTKNGRLYIVKSHNETKVFASLARATTYIGFKVQ